MLSLCEEQTSSAPHESHATPSYWRHKETRDEPAAWGGRHDKLAPQCQGAHLGNKPHHESPSSPGPPSPTPVSPGPPGPAPLAVRVLRYGPSGGIELNVKRSPSSAKCFRLYSCTRFQHSQRTGANRSTYDSTF